MKRLRLFISVLTIIIAILSASLIMAPPAHAKEVRSQDNIVIKSGETIPTTLFANGSTIDVEGTIDGDFYCVGSNVVISGTIKGDVVCMAQSINISGQVNGNLRLVATDLNVSGQVQRNALVLSQNFILTDKGTIGGELVLFGAESKLNGTIGRSAALYSQNVTLGGAIGGDVSGQIMQLNIENGAAIKGSVVYTGNTDAIKMSGAKIGGNLTRINPAQAASASFASLVFGFLLFVVSLLIVSMATVWAFPKFYQSTDKTIQASIGKTSLYGLANLILVPIVATILLITGIGAPLGLLIFIGWALSLILCGPVFAFFVGGKILHATGRKTSNPYLTMFVGSIVVLLLYGVPVVNLLTGIAVSVVGSGAIMSYFKHANRQARPKK